MRVDQAGAHLQVGSEEERIVPGDLVPAQVISQEEDDVRLGLRTTLPWLRGGGYNKVSILTTEPANINTTKTTTMLGNMIYLHHYTVALSLQPILERVVSLNSPPSYHPQLFKLDQEPVFFPDFPALSDRD